MKHRIIRNTIVLLLTSVLLLTNTPISASAQTVVSGSRDIVYGADIGYLSQLENQGVQWIDDTGKEKDALQLLKDKGVNAVRLRVFVKPPSDFYWTKPDGTRCMLGYADTKGLLYSAKRAKNLGMKVMVVFHYSDHFADPLIQDVPSEWKGVSSNELTKYVYDYTKYIMSALKQEGVTPEWVQVGNEVSYGILYPSGSNQTNDFTQLTKYLNSGYDAVKSVSPSTKVVTHLTHGSGIKHFDWFFTNFIEKCGGKTDVIGMSYYPYWTSAYDGDCIENVSYNLSKMAAKYNKEVMICETGEVETEPDKTNELLKKESNAIAAVPNGKGIGVFYWEPEVNSTVLPDKYILGATENKNGKLHFTKALDAFQNRPDFLNDNVQYEILNTNSNKSMNVKQGSAEDGTHIEQYSYGDWDSQKWKIVPAHKGYYQIINKGTGKCLSVENESLSENASIVQNTNLKRTNQEWKIIMTEDGYYRFQNRKSGMYLRVFNGSTYDQAWIVQGSANSNDSKWLLLVAD